MIERSRRSGLYAPASHHKYVAWVAYTSYDIKLEIRPAFIWDFEDDVVVLDLFRILVDPRGGKDRALLTRYEHSPFDDGRPALAVLMFLGLDKLHCESRVLRQPIDGFKLPIECLKLL